jgi:hypothetical protein
MCNKKLRLKIEIKAYINIPHPCPNEAIIPENRFFVLVI